MTSESREARADLQVLSGSDSADPTRIKVGPTCYHSTLPVGHPRGHTPTAHLWRAAAAPVAVCVCVCVRSHLPCAGVRACVFNLEHWSSWTTCRTRSSWPGFRNDVASSWWRGSTATAGRRTRRREPRAVPANHVDRPGVNGSSRTTIQTFKTRPMDAQPL